MIPSYKICPSCQVEKESSAFHIRKDKGKVYLKSYCKKCANKKTIETQYDLCECGNRKTKKSKTCQACSNLNKCKYETLEHTLKYRNKHGQSASFAVIRSRARTIMKNVKSCQRCGYDKHVEVCHIKPICSYPPDTPIDVVNDISNLLVLCPNCHWEFDNK